MGQSKETGGIRRRNPERTKASILDAAFVEFARHGYGGSRVHRIARNARCNPRMIYHYFGGKQKLYVAVIERAHEDIRAQEMNIGASDIEPLDGLLSLLDFAVEYFSANPNFEALLRTENMMKGRFVLRSKVVRESAYPLRISISSLLKRGSEDGTLRNNLDAAQVYVTIMALARFHQSYAYTLSAVLNTDLHSPSWGKSWKQHIRDVLESYLTRARN